MKFFFGIAIGAVGMWAYKTGKLPGSIGGASESMQHAWEPAAERFSQVANSDQVQHAVSTVKDRMPSASEIATPSAAEVSGRPAEPLPTSGA